MLHYCEYCEFNSKHKWVVKRHTEKKHKIYFNNNNITNNESKLIEEAIKINSAPNHEPLHNIQYGSGSTVIPIEKYNQAVETSHAWKNAYDNLYNQTGSGIFTQGDIDEVHKHGVEAIRKWEIALGKEKENNKQLKEELHYEKVAKDLLPIHMNDKYLNIISLLRGVKKGDNMGYYTNRKIHCICEALYNIVYCTDVIAKGLMRYKLKNELLPIENSIMRLANPKCSMKKKRQILSEPQVGKGVFTAIASFVIPALMSILTKKST